MALRTADALTGWLEARGVAVTRKQGDAGGPQYCTQGQDCAPADLHCVFVLGGDGTFLSAVRWIGIQAIPVLGVKFGEVGFLAEATEAGLYPIAEAILNDTFDTFPRMRLVVEISRDGKIVTRERVLNDVVINKGALARLADIRTSINDHYLTTYRADGLVVSTPTGSTAYSLAAGGPIMHPAVPGIVMTPISPFTLTNRPLIVPDTARITMQLAKKSSDIMLTFDGQVGLAIDEQDTILIRKCDQPVLMVAIPDQHYFDVLKNKLRWSGGRA